MRLHMTARRPVSWVVYQSVLKGQTEGPNAVCDQAEWEALEAAAPGVNRLIRGGITSEGEAERLARGTSGDRPPRMTREAAAAREAEAA